MATNCCCLLRFNTTIEEGDGSKLSRLFRYNNTIEQMTAHCRRLLLLKHREDKTHKNTTKKIQEKGKSLPSSSRFALSLLTPASTFLLLHFRFKCFLLASSSFQTHKKTKRREGAYPFIFGSHFYLSAFSFLFQALSYGIFFFSSRR